MTVTSAYALGCGRVLNLICYLHKSFVFKPFMIFSVAGDDDSVCSGQSARSRTPQPTPTSNISVSPTPNNTADILKQNNGLTYNNSINPQHLQSATASRKRKSGFYGKEVVAC